MQNEQANEPVELSTEDEIKIITDKCDKTNYKEILYATNFNSVDLSKATTDNRRTTDNRKDNTPSFSC